MTIPVTQRGVQWLAAVVAITGAGVLAVADLWPFDTTPPALPADPSLWQFMLSDDITLGFVRLGLVVLALFVIASVPALIVGGRWVKGFGTSGLTADDAAAASESLEEAKKKLDETQEHVDELTRERDEAHQLLRTILGG